MAHVSDRQRDASSWCRSRDDHGCPRRTVGWRGGDLLRTKRQATGNVQDDIDRDLVARRLDGADDGLRAVNVNEATERDPEG